jgi:hypothetical protein
VLHVQQLLLADRSSRKNGKESFGLSLSKAVNHV